MRPGNFGGHTVLFDDLDCGALKMTCYAGSRREVAEESLYARPTVDQIAFTFPKAAADDPSGRVGAQEREINATSGGLGI